MYRFQFDCLEWISIYVIRIEIDRTRMLHKDVNKVCRPRKIYEKINKDFCVFIYLRYSSTYTSNKPQCVCSFFFVLYVRVRMYILYGLGWVFREIWPWKNVYDILPPATKGNKNETTIFIYRPFYLYSV